MAGFNLVCKSNKEHEKFTTIAHVTQEWVVEKNGHYQEVLEDCIDVTHGPSSESNYTCFECGSEVIVELK